VDATSVLSRPSPSQDCSPHLSPASGRVAACCSHTKPPVPPAVLTVRDLSLPYGRLREGSLQVKGPERIALVGRNGAGKTTLLRTLTGELAPSSGEATASVPLKFLPQRLDVLDDTLSVAANVARTAPGTTDNQIRSQLARFLFKGARAEQPAGTLSGGERFRAALAATMLAAPAPQLLLLDEPTNNLDLASVRQLTSALESYEGALVIAGHDLPFLESVGITRWILLDDELRESDAEEVRELFGSPEYRLPQSPPPGPRPGGVVGADGLPERRTAAAGEHAPGDQTAPGLLVVVGGRGAPVPAVLTGEGPASCVAPLEGPEKSGDRDREPVQAGDAARFGRRPRQPAAHRPGVRVSLARLPFAQDHGDGHRQRGREPGEPEVLLRELGGDQTPHESRVDSGAAVEGRGSHPPIIVPGAPPRRRDFGGAGRNTHRSHAEEVEGGGDADGR